MTTTPDIEIAVLADAELGEGPTWNPVDDSLVWVDILRSRIHTFTPGTDATRTIATEQHVGAAKPREGGGFVVNLRDGVGLHDTDGTFRWLHHSPSPGRRGNDAAVAPDGTLWAGSMRYDERAGGGELVRVSGDGSVDTILPKVTVSNGTGWSPDGSTVYHVDSPTRRVDTLLVEDGRVVARRPFASIEPQAGFPDGLTVDAEGCVWVALWDGGQIRRYTPRGTLDLTVTLPVARPTACAFGGPGLRDLYVTTARTGLVDPHPLAGSLLVLPGMGQGLPSPAFAG